MGLKFDQNKSILMKDKPKKGIDFYEVQEIWSHPYSEHFCSDDPEQFRANGWVKGKLYSVIFEVREDAEGEFYHLITLWKSTKEEIKLYEKNI